MAELVEAVKITNSESLPEELQGFEIVGKSEQGKIVGKFEDGQEKGAGSAASLLLKTLVEVGLAEEIPPEPEMTEPERLLQAKVEELEHQLEAEHRQHTSEIKELERQHMQEMDALRQEFGQYKEATESRIRMTLDVVSDVAHNSDMSESTKEKVEKRLEEIREPETEPEPEPKAAGEETIQPGTLLDVEWADGSRGEGLTAVSSVWHDPKREKYITVMDRDQVARPVSVKRTAIHEDRRPADGFPPIETTTARGRPVVTRENLSSRVRRRLTGSPPAPQYYEDNAGRFYYMKEGRPVYVTREEIEEYNAGPLAPVAALGALVLAGFIGYELHKTGGHNYSQEFNEIISQNRAIKHQVHEQIASLKLADKAQYHDLRHNMAVGHDQMMDAIVADHAKDMKAIHGLRERLNQSDTLTAYKFAFRYPWDWAADKVGIYRATPYLHALAAKAADHGHKVQWLFSGRHSILKIDNTTNSRHVIGVLSEQR